MCNTVKKNMVRCTNCEWFGDEDDLVLVEYDEDDEDETPTAIESKLGVERLGERPEIGKVAFLKGCPECHTDAYLSDVETYTYEEAFDEFIKDKKVTGSYYNRPLIMRDGTYDTYEQYYAYVHGLLFENGYVWASHGGGCSGEDCNQTFIISPDNKFIAGFNW